LGNGKEQSGGRGQKKNRKKRKRIKPSGKKEEGDKKNIKGKAERGKQLGAFWTRNERLKRTTKAETEGGGEKTVGEKRGGGSTPGGGKCELKNTVLARRKKN